MEEKVMRNSDDINLQTLNGQMYEKENDVTK